jgi:hypothetical protein
MKEMGVTTESHRTRGLAMANFDGHITRAIKRSQSRHTPSEADLALAKLVAETVMPALGVFLLAAEGGSVVAEISAGPFVARLRTLHGQVVLTAEIIDGRARCLMATTVSGEGEDSAQKLCEVPSGRLARAALLRLIEDALIVDSESTSKAA